LNLAQVTGFQKNFQALDSINLKTQTLATWHCWLWTLTVVLINKNLYAFTNQRVSYLQALEL